MSNKAKDKTPARVRQTNRHGAGKNLGDGAVGEIDERATEIVGITKATMDRLLGGDRPAEAIALYMFYTYTGTWQKTNRPKAGTSYCAKGLGWGEEKVRKVKKILIGHGLVQDITGKNGKGIISGHYIHLPYKLKQSTLKKGEWEVHPPEDPPSGESRTNTSMNGTKMLTGKKRTEEQEVWNQDSIRNSSPAMFAIPEWQQVQAYGDEMGIPLETQKAFYLTNQANGWKTKLGNRTSKIRDWKKALIAFAETDRKRLSEPKPISSESFWKFVLEDMVREDYGTREELVVVGNLWIAFMREKGWKYPDKITGTPMPVRDHCAVFRAWFLDTWCDPDLKREEWTDSYSVPENECLPIDLSYDHKLDNESGISGERIEASCTEGSDKKEGNGGSRDVADRAKVDKLRVRLCQMFGHPDGLMNNHQVNRAWKALLRKSRVTEADVELLEWWYGNKKTPPPKLRGRYWARAAVPTLLRNWEHDLLFIRNVVDEVGGVESAEEEPEDEEDDQAMARRGAYGPGDVYVPRKAWPVPEGWYAEAKTEANDE